MKKLLKIMGFALLAGTLFFTSCKLINGGGNGGNGENGENGENGNTSSGETKQLLKFAAGGAKALGIVDNDDNGMYASARSARSAETDAMIVKILEDGSFESFMSIPEGSSGDIAPINYIAQSPNPDSHEIYIVFNYNSWINTPVERTDEGGNTWNDWESVTIGQLLCVHEDGTYDDILQQDDGTWKCLYGSDKDSIAFDNLGNIYYLFQESSGNSWTNMIYKYDPKTKTSSQLTPAVENTYYEKFQVSGDGNWIFAKANRWNNNNSANYLRAIPVSDPTNSIDLFYSSGNGSSGWINDWIYDDDAHAIYYNLSGTLYRIQEKDGTFSKDNRELLFSGDSSSWFNYSGWEDSLFVWKNSNGSYNYTSQTSLSLDGSYPSYDENGDYEGTERDPTSSYKNYYFRNPLTEEQEIDEAVVLEFIVDKAYSSFTLEAQASEISAIVQKDKTTGNYIYKSKLLDKYDIRFDTFTNDIGFEMLATATAGKTNLEAIKAISSNDLVSLFCDLFDSENSPYKKSGAGYYDMYDRNFYADILYKKGTDEKIDKSHFHMSDVNNTKFSTMGFYNTWDLFTWTNSNSSNYTWNSIYTKNKSVSVNNETVIKSVVDAEKVLAKLATFCTTKDIDFKLTAFKDMPKYSALYTDVLNEEAIEFLDNPARIKLLIQYMDEKYDCNNGNGKFLHITCFKKDTDEPAYAWKDSNANSIWWGNVGNFTTSYKKSLYGSYDSNIVEIIDEDGTPKGQYIDVGALELNVVSTIIGDDGFFFLNALLDSTGEEIGKHQIYYYDVATKEMINLFQNVPDKENLEVTSFSAGGNYVYFSAVKGFDILTAKIDTTTYSYSLLGSGQKLTQIIVVK